MIQQWLLSFLTSLFTEKILRFVRTILLLLRASMLLHFTLPLLASKNLDKLRLNVATLHGRVVRASLSYLNSYRIHLSA